MADSASLTPWLDRPHHGETRAVVDRFGTEHHLPVRYPNVTATPLIQAEEEQPGLFHTAFALEGFHFCDRIDLYAVGSADEEALLVDTGHYDLCGTAFLDRMVEAIGAGWEGADLFLTHLHDDHVGNVPYCLHQGARHVYRGVCRPYDPARAQEFLQVTGAVAAGDEELDEFAAFLMGEGNPLFQDGPALDAVSEGAAFDRAGWHLEVLDTPGHTAEHRCLIDRERGVLFAGDHLIFGAPGVMQLQADQHLLGHYLGSMAALRRMNLCQALLSHHEALVGTEAVNGLIDRIVAVHDRPLAKAEAVLRAEGPATIYQAAVAYDAGRPAPLADQPRAVRARRVATMFGYLDYLADTERARRHVADDGSLVYEAR